MLGKGLNSVVPNRRYSLGENGIYSKKEDKWKRVLLS
jgi:hypothetical protein